MTTSGVPMQKLDHGELIERLRHAAAGFPVEKHGIVSSANLPIGLKEPLLEAADVIERLSSEPSVLTEEVAWRERSLALAGETIIKLDLKDAAQSAEIERMRKALEEIRDMRVSKNADSVWSGVTRCRNIALQGLGRGDQGAEPRKTMTISLTEDEMAHLQALASKVPERGLKNLVITREWFERKAALEGDLEIGAGGLELRDQGAAQSRAGIYVASRASIPERSRMWRHLRDACGYPITASWIDEAGEGETADQGELWTRILAEVTSAKGLVFYAEPGDFPLKGAYVEIGMALAAGIPVAVVAPDVEIDSWSCRPIGSWMRHPLVRTFNDVTVAISELLAPLPSPPEQGEN